MLIAITLIFPIARAIIKIKRMCGHDMSNFFKESKDNDPASSKDNKHYGPTASPSMEKAFEDLNNNSILNHQNVEHNLEDAIRKACEIFAALTSVKDARTFAPLR